MFSPGSVVANPRGTLTLHVTASSTEPLTYQWRTQLSGSNTPTLVFSNYTSAAAGQYDCVVSSDCGPVTSSAATLTCLQLFESGPSDGSYPAGSAVLLTTSVQTGAGATYRWRKDGIGLFNSSLYAGVSTPSLTIFAEDPIQSGVYSLAVTNSCGTRVLPGAVIVIFCPSDLDDGTGNGIADGGTDIGDLIYFLDLFEAGSSQADLDDGTGTGDSDGGVNISDLLYFLAHFEGGC